MRGLRSRLSREKQITNYWQGRSRILQEQAKLKTKSTRLVLCCGCHRAGARVAEAVIRHRRFAGKIAI